MKRLEVIVLPAKFDEVADALEEAGIQGVTACEIRLFGSANGRRIVYRGSSHLVDCVLRVRVEMVIRNDVVPRILELLEQSSGIGRADSGVIVSDVVDATRIRTAEQSEEVTDHPASSLHSAA
jgi:nitrogen regulatory protein P-II 1